MLHMHHEACDLFDSSLFSSVEQSPCSAVNNNLRQLEIKLIHFPDER